MIPLWLVWANLLFWIGLGSYTATGLDFQLLVALLSMVVLPIPVGMTTGKLGRTVFAVFLPLFCLVLLAKLVPGATLVQDGRLIALLMITPVACANALCPPPYRLSILLLQTFWIWFENGLFFQRGYLAWNWTLGLALVGPILFLVTALMGRAVPPQPD